MSRDDPRYIPALRFRWLTRLYDPVLRATMRERSFKRHLVERLSIRPGHRVLDLGCGTATLTILIKQACPAAHVVGMDGDEEILGIASEKARQSGVAIELRRGLVTDPPFESGSFDRVVSSLVFHHLTTQTKRKALEQIHSLLAPGGELYLADWGKPHNTVMRLAFLAVRLLDGFETTADNAAGLLPKFMEETGFTSVTEIHRETALVGTLSIYRGVKAPAPS